MEISKTGGIQRTLYFSLAMQTTPSSLTLCNARALQNAINKCNNPNGSGITEACSFLTVTNATFADKCKLAATVDETIDGQLTRLPG
jgi:hypothetical protein